MKGHKTKMQHPWDLRVVLLVADNDEDVDSIVGNMIDAEENDNCLETPLDLSKYAEA